MNAKTERKQAVLVAGATGNQGGAVARRLLGSGHSVRALTRGPESPKALELARLGASVVQGALLISGAGDVLTLAALSQGMA